MWRFSLNVEFKNKSCLFFGVFLESTTETICLTIRCLRWQYLKECWGNKLRHSQQVKRDRMSKPPSQPIAQLRTGLVLLTTQCDYVTWISGHFGTRLSTLQNIKNWEDYFGMGLYCESFDVSNVSDLYKPDASWILPPLSLLTSPGCSLFLWFKKPL